MSRRRGTSRSKTGRSRDGCSGGGSWTIYEDRYTVKQDSRADGRTVLAGENGDIVAAVYADDLDLIGAGGSVPAPTPESTPDAKPFPDVPASAWYAEAVNGLSARGIVNGYPDGSFKPEQTATRAEVAVMLYRALKSFAQNANDNK